MDGSQFDRLARAIGATHTRRSAATLLAAAGALPLLGREDSEAGKKKKKKCKAPKVKCGKKCLPAGSCCAEADCGPNGTCQGNTCVCFSGFRRCNGTCIPQGTCCSNTECGGGVCSGGQCQCLQGTKPCNGKCIPDGGCCTNADCGSPCKMCQNNVCSAGCGAGQTCLDNGSCGSTCSEAGACNQTNTCSCNINRGDDVCRRAVGANPGEVSCASQLTCTSTANCPSGTVCSSICRPSRCIPLCPN